MGRKRSRVLVFQILYAMEIQGDFCLDIARAMIPNRLSSDSEACKYILETVASIIEKKDEIDGWLGKYLENWSLDRVAAVERSILRLAIYELIYRFDVPLVVVINEAIKLAKIYGGEESGAFVNGILDRIAHHVRRHGDESEAGQSAG